ncbi:MAG: hypothetical protein ACJ790_11445 [Myxococcaceae bacterium]
MLRRSTLLALLLLISCARNVPTASTSAEPLDAGVLRTAIVVESVDAGGAELADTSCPAQEPTRGQACTKSGKRCAYGPRPDCGTVWDCYGTFWDPIQTLPCVEANRGRCPAQLASSPPSGVTPDDNLSCVYPNGLICAFRYPEPSHECSGVARREPPPPHASWSCAPATPPCARTDLQGRCTQEGLTCGTTCCGMGMICQGGQWTPKEYPCPQ